MCPFSQLTQPDVFFPLVLAQKYLGGKRQTVGCRPVNRESSLLQFNNQKSFDYVERAGTLFDVVFDNQSKYNLKQFQTYVMKYNLRWGSTSVTLLQVTISNCSRTSVNFLSQAQEILHFSGVFEIVFFRNLTRGRKTLTIG